MAWAASNHKAPLFVVHEYEQLDGASVGDSTIRSLSINLRTRRQIQSVVEVSERMLSPSKRRSYPLSTPVIGLMLFPQVEVLHGTSSQLCERAESSKFSFFQAQEAQRAVSKA